MADTGKYVEGIWLNGPNERVGVDNFGNKCKVITITIDDEKYFCTLDNQVRHYFASFEVRECLPKAIKVLKDAGITENELKEYPVEGYYYKSEELRKYFKMIRNMQQNEELFPRLNAIKEGNAELAFLSNILESDIFGNPVPAGQFYPWPNAPLKRRWDILTHTMSDKSLFNEHAKYPWDIPHVLAGLTKHFSGRTNLPELAVLVGKPELICAACETNSLGRMYACLSGSFAMASPRVEYIWAVTPKVYEMGQKIIDLYNSKTLHKDYLLLQPTLETIHGVGSWQKGDFRSFDYSLETPRVAHLGFLTEPCVYYFWILDETGTLKDTYTREFITTETYAKQTHPWYNQAFKQHA